MKPFVGTNCYYLLTRSAAEGCRPMVEQTLDALAAANLTVVRIWAFNDGPGWMSLQPTAGQLSEEVLVGMDWLLVQAAKRGLQLMMTLTNYWSEFGGMPQYVRWSRGLPDGAEASGNDFWTDAKAQELYRDFVTAVVTRVNSITGVAYKDDPAIHSWDLANEPRNEGDASAEAIAAWIDSAAAHVKSLDPNHYVTVGTEGFFGPSAPEYLGANPYNVTHGVDFVRECASPHVDFCSIHAYPSQWLPASSSDAAAQTEWILKWTAAHARACAERLGGKPLCLQEFGFKPAGTGREALFAAVADQFREALALAGSSGGATGATLAPLRGALVWMFAHTEYEDYDGYTVYCHDEAFKITAKLAEDVAEAAPPAAES